MNEFRSPVCRCARGRMRVRGSARRRVCARARECMSVCAHRTGRTRVPGARPPSFLLPPPGGGRAPTLTPCPRSPAQPRSAPATCSAPHPSPALEVLEGAGCRGRRGDPRWGSEPLRAVLRLCPLRPLARLCSRTPLPVCIGRVGSSGADAETGQRPDSSTESHGWGHSPP